MHYSGSILDSMSVSRFTTMKHGLTCIRRRSIGKSAKDCTENRMSPKTERSSDNLEASTTEDDMAAFMESTEVSLEAGSERS